MTISGWAFDPSAPTQPLAIRAVVGGKRGTRSSAGYELGPVAVQPRSDIALAHRAAGAAHGFGITFPVAASGRQRICVYAVNVGAGSDRSLGCRTVGIRVPIVVSHIKLRQKAIWVNVRCQWPAGTSCPGHILLRGRVRVRQVVRHGRRRLIRYRPVRAQLAGRVFELPGGASHAFSVHLSRRGRLLTRGAGELRAKLLVAIPGGRRGRALTLAPRARLAALTSSTRRSQPQVASGRLSRIVSSAVSSGTPATIAWAAIRRSKGSRVQVRSSAAFVSCSSERSAICRPMRRRRAERGAEAGSLTRPISWR